VFLCALGEGFWGCCAVVGRCELWIALGGRVSPWITVVGVVWAGCRMCCGSFCVEYLGVLCMRICRVVACSDLI
jgi:hypothetical protein